MVIPALAPTLDKSLKSDRSLCPVRALRYYLDRTADLRQHKELVFVSFKKGFDKDISPATISSWIKQTVILCYELSDHQAHTLHQVKAHDVRAFAASKAFSSPTSGDTGRLFLTFGGLVRADRISYCPLDRVLTYKNLIYLLNLQFYLLFPTNISI